jgi:hypothetical protein
VLLYLYAVADAIEASDGLMGIGGEPVEIFDLGGLRLAAGWVDERPSVSRPLLETQDRLVRALHERSRALLPFRFGTAARDLAAASTSLDLLASDLAQRLARVRGREQMTVRILRAGGEPAARAGSAVAAPNRELSLAAGDGPGAQYLRARAASRELPEHVHRALDAVRSIVREARFEPARHAAVLGTVYHLIDRGTSPVYRDRLTAAADAGAVTLRITGPSPAYAF